MKGLSQGQRKTLMFLAALISINVLCWFGKMDGSMASNSIVLTLGVAIGGNAVEHLSKRPQATP